MKNSGSVLFEKIFLKNRRAYFWIAGLAFLVYLPTLFFGFTYLDDNILIIDHYNFLRNLGHIPQAFKQQVFFDQGAAFYYRPLLTISFMLGAQWTEVNPLPHHLVNIVFHLAASLLIMLFLIKLGYARAPSFWAAAIFAVHPVLTQAVAWLPGRNDSLLAVLALASFIAFLDFEKTKKWSYYFIHLAFFSLALFAKENAVFLILLCLLYLKIILREKLFSAAAAKIASGWIIILAVWWELRSLALGPTAPALPLEEIKSVFVNLPGIFLYLGKVFLPVNLSVLPILKDSTLIFGFLATAALVLLLFFSKQKNWRLIIFGAAWFLIFLLPSFIRPDIANADFIEHRIYLPLAGFIVLFLEILPAKLADFNQKRTWVFGFAVAIIFSTITLIHNQNFKDGLSFWKNAARRSPHSPLAHRNLGVMRYFAGELDQAEEEYRQALELNPEEPMAHNNLGLIYMDQNRFEQAEEEYKKELIHNPYYDKAHFNLGLLYYRAGRFKEAEASWLKTISINPAHVQAYLNLAGYYASQEDRSKAEYFFNQAARAQTSN